MSTFSMLLEHALSFKYLLLVAIFLILVYKWSFSTNPSSVSVPPPSPPKLPLIGHLHQLGERAHRSLLTLAKRHGPDIMLLHLGSRPVVVISSAEAASQIYKTHDHSFSDRPKLIFFEKIMYNYKDVASAPYGEYWRQVRGLCVSNLLSNKMVRSLSAVRLEETKNMMSNIISSCTRPSSSSTSSFSSSALNLSEMIFKLMVDTLSRVVIGRKCSDHGDASVRMIIELIEEVADLFAVNNIGDFIPWLAWVTRLNGLDAKLKNVANRWDDFLEKVVQEHIDDLNNGMNNKNEEEKDFVDVILSFHKENGAQSLLDRSSIKGIIMDMFVTGTDTTFTTIEWTISELIKNPIVMKKLQNEVRQIVGDKMEITEDDLVGMHYLKAVIKETFRLHPPIPILIPRMSNQDVKINNYYIKANTQLMVNTWAIGRDPKAFANPELYEPERFMNSTIDFKGNNYELIPFGAGRRVCPGIQFSIAIQELLLVNLVHKIDWSLPNGMRGEDLDMSESTGSVAHRKYPLKAIATLSK